MDKVTIIVPAYNLQDYLGDCLNSIINQTYSNLEVLVIDDGSTDNTYQVGMNFANQDSRIKVISQKHQGIARARNNGLQHTTGDLLTFIDGDDFVESTYLSNLVAQLQKYNSEIAVSFYKIKDAKTNQFFVLTSLPPENEKFNGVYSPADWLQRVSPSLNAVNDCVWGKLYRRSLFDRLRFPENYSYCQDAMGLWQVCLGANRISFLNQIDYTLTMKRPDLALTPTQQLTAAFEKVQCLQEKIATMNAIDFDYHYLYNDLKSALMILKKQAGENSDFDYHQRATSALAVLDSLAEEKNPNEN